MRLRKVKNADLKLLESPYYISDPFNKKGLWSQEFQNTNEIHLEIGTGKGDFLIAKALHYPNINFIGIEKYESVLVRAIEKMSSLDLPNIRFLCFDAKEIETVFDHEINTLYLNFSDPWPKARHAKRRLSSDEFLDKYENLFIKNAHIIQKTDNIGLFAYSLEQYSKHGYIIEKVSLDLANEKIENFPTEYETKFTSLGYKINYVEATKKKE